MITREFSLKNRINQKYLSKKIYQKLKTKSSSVFKKIEINVKNSENLLSQLDSEFKINFKPQDLKKFKKFKKIVLIGMGGSILGSKSIYYFLRHKIKKELIFLDNIDQNKIFDLIKKKDRSKTLFIITSKSGNTIETISNFFSLNVIKKNSKNIIIITEKNDNFLYSLSKTYNLFHIEHKSFIGGRYSVLSEVGLVPAYLMGLDLKKIRKSLINFKEKKKFFLQNSGMQMANLLLQNKINNLIFLNFSPRLEKFLYWCQQLIAESLGKKNLGFTPIISNAPKDHHSLLQLYLDGPKNKIFYIFDENEDDKFKINTKKFSKKIDFINKKGLNEIKNAQKRSIINQFKNYKIPFREFHIKKIDENTIGQLFSYFILETIIIGELAGINPLNQPAVEGVKKETKNILIKNTKKNF